MVERLPLTLHAADGTALEAEVALPEDVAVAAVLCHPHPEYGGSMRSIVIGALFETLPARGVACLRFNFRGVEGSGGEYTAGDSERLDAAAALEALAERVPRGTTVVLAGWSFGADVALSVTDGPHAAWVAIAPPLRFVHAVEATAADRRPKLVVLAQHDQFRNPDEVVDATRSWEHAAVEVVGGADHYFVGRTDRLGAVVADFLDSVTSEG